MAGGLNNPIIYLTHAVILLVGVVGGIYLSTSNNKSIPSLEIVEKGFANPSQLELQCMDQDHNGGNELIATYKGVSYLVKETEKGDLYVTKYIVTPAKIYEQK